MKKMFSQMIKSSLLNHSQRWVMVCVLCFITVVAVATPGGDGDWFANITAKATIVTGSGKVYAGTQATASKIAANEWKTDESLYDKTHGTAKTELSETVYWHAKADAGYYFKGWYTDQQANNLKSTAIKFSQKLTTNSDNSHKASQQYYAVFGPLSEVKLTMKAIDVVVDNVHGNHGGIYTVKLGSTTAQQITNTDVIYTQDNGLTAQDRLTITLDMKTSPQNHRLYAWRITERGVTTENRVAYDINATTNNVQLKYTITSPEVIVEPIFVRDGYAMYVVGEDFMDNEKYYENLQTALNDAKEQGKRVTVISSGKLNTTNQKIYTVPDGVTFVVPAEQTYRYQDNQLTEDDIIEGASSSTSTTAFVKFTLPADAIFNVEGKLSVYAKLNSDGKTAASTYGQIDMESGLIEGEGARINIENGGKANVYGFITGDYKDTKVVVKEGGSITEILQIRDWRGGSCAQSMIDNSQKVFFVNQFYVQNVETMLECQPGSTENISASAIISDAKLIATTTFITRYDSAMPGQVGLFLVGGQTTVKKYLDIEHDRIVIVGSSSNDNAEPTIMSNIHIKFNDLVQMNSADYVLPMPTNYDIKIQDYTTLQLQNSVSLLAGSTIYIDATSKLIMADGAFLFVYDNEQHEVWLNKKWESYESGWYNYFGASNTALAVNTSQPRTLGTTPGTYNRGNPAWNTTTDADGDKVTDKDAEGKTITTKTTLKCWGDLRPNERDYANLGDNYQTAWDQGC